jgi:hypothetical protein
MLRADVVHNIFVDCLYREDEMRGISIHELAESAHGHGVVHKVVPLHPERLATHKEEINDLLDELHNDFKEGMSFLKMPFDKHNHQWGEHPNCEELLILGDAIGRIEFCLPRDMWSALPGGVPYFFLLDREGNHYE